MGLINSDIPELEGTDTETALSNLDELERELEPLLERRLAHIAELADSIVSDGEDEDIIKSIILSVRYDPEMTSDRISEINARDIKALCCGLSLAERLILLRQICSRLYSSKNPYFKNYFSAYSVSASLAPGKIAYLKNSYNDAAYLAFSHHLHSPTSYYAQSVTEVCEAVLDGTCEYCILPLQTASDGKLLSFYRLILKYGLKINLVYDMPGRTNKDHTVYALLSRSVLTDNVTRLKTKDKRFDFMVSSFDGVSIAEIMMAAQLCSLELCSVDTMPLQIADGQIKEYFCLSYRTGSADINTFLSHLSIDCPDFIPIGMYSKI